MDRNTGRRLSGWPHVEQSLGVLLTTSRRSRIMRRHVGAGLPRRVDMPVTPANLIDLYADTAAAIVEQEPRFRPQRMTVDEVPVDGRIKMNIAGVYYPRGHLGDFSVSEPKAAGVVL